MDPRRLPLILTGSVIGLGVPAAGFLFVSGHPDWGRGVMSGIALSSVYLLVLRRYVGAFVGRALGQRVGPLDRVILRAGSIGRYGLVGAGFSAVARAHPAINLWATILAFFLFRLLLGIYQISVWFRARREPLPPPLPPEEGEDRFTSRERWRVGRRRSWRQGR
ncbi:MAG: hypothetical protein VKO64_13155 [Candidatus Sericytochromatia bacterium]|nr:hypothetical protein [Candidatus Sericytochromatia bacterium]